MKIQEAIENLKYLISDDCTDNQMDFVEEIEMAINALEKQIPKKPVKSNPICYAKTKDGKELHAYTYRCTVCYANVKIGTHHCSCGQTLDWNNHPTEKGGASDA